MEKEELHKFTSEDWKLLETQFSGFSFPVIDFVTENKGSLSEAEEVYITAFIYYTQLLELHGLKLTTKAEDLIYSFSRKLWIKVLGKRNVDINFVKHRRSFFEMEDAFHEIESINERSEKTAEKLAEVGEPARTLVLEHLGRNKDLSQVGARLGYSDEDKAFAQLSKSIRKLIKLSEGKNFDLTETEFQELVRYVLDKQREDSSQLNEEKKVAVTMISRSAAMIRSYVIRNQRIQKLKEMQERVHPDTHLALEKSAPNPNKVNKKMKPAAVFALSAVVALSVSVLTAFGITNLHKLQQQPESEITAVTDTISSSITEPAEEPVEEIEKSAFAISSDGLFVTTANAQNGTKVKLNNSDGANSLIGEVVYVDTLQNLAFVKCELDKPTRLPYMLALADPKIAESMYAVGFFNNLFFYSEGIINASTNGSRKIKLDNATEGSPVISDNGQILGMVLASSSTENICALLTCSQIKDAISTYEKKNSTKVQLTSRNGLFYSNRTDQVEKLKPFVYKVENI